MTIFLFYQEVQQQSLTQVVQLFSQVFILLLKMTRRPLRFSEGVGRTFRLVAGQKSSFADIQVFSGSFEFTTEDPLVVSFDLWQYILFPVPPLGLEVMAVEASVLLLADEQNGGLDALLGARAAPVARNLSSGLAFPLHPSLLLLSETAPPNVINSRPFWPITQYLSRDRSDLL